jgi:hypothetical protein
LKRALELVESLDYLLLGRGHSPHPTAQISSSLDRDLSIAASPWRISAAPMNRMS